MYWLDVYFAAASPPYFTGSWRVFHFFNSLNASYHGLATGPRGPLKTVRALSLLPGLSEFN